MQFRSTSVSLLLSIGLALLIQACDLSSVPEEQLVASLFSTDGAVAFDPGRRTYVVWVNGDADHFVPVASVGSGSDLYRADSVEVERMRRFASECRDCNVVLLHIQRGGERWYTSEAPWATYLRVYSRGQQLLERSVPILDAADPGVIAGLLGFSQGAFPGSETHFLYRGHSFVPAYAPGQNRVAPFAYSFPETPFGPEQFVEGIRRAGLRAPLDSVTLAACSMAYLDVATRLAPFARQLVTSQVDVLETLTASFGFSFLADDSFEGDTASHIAETLMRPFETTDHPTEAMMEYPVSQIDLSLASGLADGLERLETEIERASPGFFARNKVRILQAARVEKVLSDRYLASLRGEGKSVSAIETMEKFIRAPADDPEEIDAGQLLDFLASARKWPKAVSARIARARSSLSRAVRLIGSPSDSGKSGLSLRVSDLPVEARP